MTVARRVAILGFGRVGGSLARGLRAAGYEVAVRSRAARRRGDFPLASAQVLARADMVIACVPDGAVAAVAQATSPMLSARTVLVHCAGALTLEALGRHPQRGSFHPLCAVSSDRDALEGHAVAISATSRRAGAMLRGAARALGLWPLSVDERQRARYHAGAVMGAGLVVALVAAARDVMVECGVPPNEAERGLLALAQSALRGAARHGLGAGLTGPIVRGDAATVDRHLRALPASERDLYAALSRRALALAGERVPPQARRSLTRALL